MTTIGVAQSALALPPPGEASVWVPIVPCRLMDTRPDTTVGERNTPLAASETATVAVVGAHGNCVIPDSATGITGNLTATHPTATSFLTVFPADADLPNASTLNWRAASAPVANHIAVSLSPDAMPTELAGSVNVFNHAGTVNVILDITGYFAPAETTGGLGDLGCDTDQSIQWNGETWTCADPVVDTDTDTLAALECTTNQSIRWTGEEWECRYEPLVATLSRAPESPVSGGITEMFQAYSPNVDVTAECDEAFCTLRLTDVVDHTSCTVTLTGNSEHFMVYREHHVDRIDMYGLYLTVQSEPLYVNVSCFK